MKSFIVCILAICAVFAVVESKKFELKSRIVGGDFAVDGQFPYQVSLRQTRTRSHHCGASIISPRFLLTAAHCVQGGAADPKNLYAVVGTILPSEKGTAYPLDRIIPHEEYGPTAITNDIAFLRTAKTIVFNEFVQPIALPTRNTPADLPAYISGWGVTKTHGPGTKYMKYAKTHTISQKQCYDLHKKFRMEHRIVETSLCAFEQNGDGVCNGDSGGPLADWSQDDRRKELIGIVSWEVNPCGGNPDVFTRVFLYKNWILTQMYANSDLE